MSSIRSLRRAMAALALAGLALGAACADDAALRDTISRELQHPALAHGWTGVYIRSLEDYQVLFAQNEDRLFIPASNMKLLVSATANDVLPPDFRYTTPVLRDGTLDGGTLRGNLYLKGSADPTLETKDLRALARAVFAAGITRVEGDVVGDDSILDDRRIGSGWQHDYLPYYYAAEVSGLTADRGTVNLRVMPGDVGQPPTASLDPDAGYMLIRNNATTVPDAQEETLSVGRIAGTNIITLSGGIRRGNKGHLQGVTMMDPGAYTAHLFRLILSENGVEVTGAARKGSVPADAQQVAVHHSPTLPTLLSLLNKPSDNLIAETLLKTLGLVRKERGTTAAGAEVEREFLKRIGVGPNEVSITDGSGLARQNLVTPGAIVSILNFMWTHPNREAFVQSLPVAGVDGTLRRRMVGTPAEKKVLAKTGYVGRARSLSGYVISRDGETYAFSMLMNHYTGTTADINGIQDRILAAIAASTR